MKVNKIYVRTSTSKGLHWSFDNENKHFTLRLAGNPSFVLEQFRNKYGEDGELKYIELLKILNNISEDGYSPFVVYVNEKIEIQKKEQEQEESEVKE